MKDKNYHDINPMAGDTYHHSVGLHFRSLDICLDIQCKKAGAAKVEAIKAAIEEIMKGKK